jgi:hypothetical protein
LKNLRTRLFILSVSLVSTAGAVMVLVKPIIMGGIRGIHDGND